MPYPDRQEVLDFAREGLLHQMTALAGMLRDSAKGDVVTYSPKVFIPLTRLCRDVCHYCTYATTPRYLQQMFLSPNQVLEIARAGEKSGCREALFTLGDKPELRYRAAREALRALGCDSTLEYVSKMAELVLKETSLLPHLNPGVLTLADYHDLRPFAASMGLMLESSARRLCERGGPHFGSPDKDPEVRLSSIAAAGKAKVPLTSGILIGIGETREERIDSLLALRELHQEYEHIQEVIIQNFTPKPATAMAKAKAPHTDELLWTIAVARYLFGAKMNIQVPPNLNHGHLGDLIAAGINDWGGVSPVTPDHVNPESPWPTPSDLEAQTVAAGKTLVERLTIYPEYASRCDRWVDPSLVARVMQGSDSSGYARCDTWSAGGTTEPPARLGGSHRMPKIGRLAETVSKAADGNRLTNDEIVRLFGARDEEFATVCSEADALRRDVCGNDVTFVVNRNINYTNLCKYKCQFCAFSKGKIADDLRGAPYVLDLEEISRRTEEAWSRGATEVCLQGGIHPSFTGNSYLSVCRAVKEAAPDIHIHAFSPLEVAHGAKTLGVSVEEFLKLLRAAGLGTLPGTAAEILDDEVRRVICPDKLTTAEWLDVVRAAHRLGIRTTATIMFGHMETPLSWARHLLAIRDLQEYSGGFTEFVPLPFVHMEAPMFKKGRARLGPTYREALLMHAVSRLVLNPLIPNIQTSWVKMGQTGASQCLTVGANDLGGTLMNESISRAAGAAHGQELVPEQMKALAVDAGRGLRQRTTLYTLPQAERTEKAFEWAPLAALRNRHARDYRPVPNGF
jgi:FO synthase